MRDIRKPTKRFSKHVGMFGAIFEYMNAHSRTVVVQAKWNRRNPSLIATAHDGTIFVS